jgi:hypothetical protein
LLYDWYVERRQRIVLTSALKSNAVVASMFPKNVRDRLLENAAIAGGNHKKEAFALDEKEGLIPTTSRSMPIADFYPETTVSKQKDSVHNDSFEYIFTVDSHASLFAGLLCRCPRLHCMG